MKFIIASVFALFISHAVLGSNLTPEVKIAEEQKILKSLLEDGHYDKYVRPVGNASADGGIIVTTNMYIRQVSLDEEDDIMDIQLVFRAEWEDERLKYTGGDLKYVSSTELPKKVWTPDIFFSNELRSYFHVTMQPNQYIRIFPTGHVLQSTRISLKLQCAFEALNNPTDTQTCDIIFASYGDITEETEFAWKSIDDPLQVSKDVIKRNGLIKRTPGTCHSTTNTGTYSCLKATLEFSRRARQVTYPFHHGGQHGGSSDGCKSHHSNTIDFSHHRC